MQKKFQTIHQIEEYFDALKIANYQGKVAYYKARTKMYLKHIDSETGLLDKYARKLEKYKVANDNKVEKQKRKAISQFQKQIKKGIDGKVAIKIVKREKTYITKSQAKEEFQLFCKISRADSDGLVEEITTGRRVHWRETQGGHFVSASINATCFNVNNVWPQFPMSNKIMSMGDKKARLEKEKYRNNLVKKIGIDAVEELERVEKYGRGQILVKSGKALYKDIFEKYQKLNDKIFAEHPGWNRRAEKDESWQKWKENHS